MNSAVVRHRHCFEYTFAGDWNWEQFYEALQPFQSHRGSTAFDVIVDVREVTQLPMDAVLHLKPAVQLAESHQGRYVVVANGSAAQTLFLTFISIYKSLAARCFLVRDMEEAHALLCKPNSDNGASRSVNSA